MSPNIQKLLLQIRQFMSGIKNYLLKHGEGRFENLVQEERGKVNIKTLQLYWRILSVIY